MAQQVKLATKPEDLDSVPEPHKIEVGNCHSKVSSDFTLMTWHIVYMCVHT